MLAQDAIAQDSAAAKSKTAALAGMVRDQFGHGLKDASVAVDKTELKAFTNDSGLFFLPGIKPGKSDFTVMHIGYAAVHFQIDLSVDSTLVLNIPMKVVQTMPGVGVTGEQVSANLIRAGYYERRTQGLGSFIGPDKIAKMSYASVPSTFLRDTRAVRVRCTTNGFQGCKVRLGNTVDLSTGQLSGCVPVIYVDGAKRTGELDEVVDASQIYSIEVYERRAIMPMQYLPSECAIGVWTWSFADVPKPGDKKP
ncbi:MAG TPA: carboxypeptidase-like regulatory domain-containing protein [Gemmatimonadaceae bacterium]